MNYKVIKYEKNYSIVRNWNFFIGCYPVKELASVPRQERLFGIDFSKYSNQGFFITPEKYNGEYESVGLLSYEYLPSGEYLTGGMSDVRNSSYNPNDKNSSYFLPVKYWHFEKINVEQVMDSVFKICKNMGADALVNFEIMEKSDDIGANSLNPSTRFGYTITGFAIKRK